MHNHHDMYRFFDFLYILMLTYIGNMPYKISKFILFPIFLGCFYAQFLHCFRYSDILMSETLIALGRYIKAHTTPYYHIMPMDINALRIINKTGCAPLYKT